MKKAVFLDKDGTLIPDIPYNVDPELITLMPNVVQGLKALQRAGYKLIIATNQSGVALGRFSEVELMRAMHRLWDLLAAEEIYPVASYYCPHAVEGSVTAYAHTCDCRKPQPGLLLRAAHDLHLSLAGSWMVGDILNDMEAGRRAGCQTILIDNGNETEWILNEWRRPDYTVADLNEAAEAILRQTNSYVERIFL